MLIDHEARVLATDPCLSCIVQAPAGSGKTEILTQRFLRLLSTVNEPEQIVALTFTRKAANEMRERVILALQRAALHEQSLAPHQAMTAQYAKQAILRSNKLGWQLLETPQRLRITTIDSLCQTLAQAIPLTEKQTPFAQLTEKPDDLYLKAARATFAYAMTHPNYTESLKTLLKHLDNRQDHLLSLFSEQLRSREQWQGLMYTAQLQDKDQFEEALQAIEWHEIERFKESIPKTSIDSLINLTRQVAALDTNPHSIRAPLSHWQSLDELSNELIPGLASLLLTSQNTLRKAFDHHVGLKRGVCSNDLFAFLKSESKALMETLEEAPDFLEALIRLKQLPSPVYPDTQWKTLQALFILLPLLNAHLHLLFNETNTVDFSAIAAQAHLALGEQDAPTDLALYLDRAIHHLLIDEFQDTSLQQFELITQLVEGFEPHEGKTLFIVGDPMQSIYRFRGAEVGLFLKAQRYGIGSIHLTPLQLRCNFRSTTPLVDWVNSLFKTLFPRKDDLESGAISFHTATPIHPARETRHIHALQYADRHKEALAITEIVNDIVTHHPTESIALLVRSRSQLTAIIRALRAKNIPYQGIDIDWLSTLAHIQDVWSLTQALLTPANRLAWLSLLRSPWCGLSLTDLHLIANVNPKQSIYCALADTATRHALSAEGLIRVTYLYDVFTEAFSQRHQQTLVQWITTTLKHLHLDAILHPCEQDDLEQFWRLLNQFEQDGQLPDISRFKDALNSLYSKQLTPSQLQIMTIHKAKGLEFDCVILPSLSAKPSNMDKPLLRWLTLPHTTNTPMVLVSPIQPSAHERCPIYDYLGQLDAEKNHYEQQRLLYVAVTRARNRLYLLDYSEKGAQGTFRALLHQVPFLTMTDITTPHPEPISHKPELTYLPLDFYPPTPRTPIPFNHSSFVFSDDFSRKLGLVTHELLLWICNHHPQTETQIPWSLVHHMLRQHHVYAAEKERAIERISAYISPLFHTPRGQWLIQQHTNERNEYELLLQQQNQIRTRIIDRTFYENGICWVIDFKTGQAANNLEKHRAQVNEYANLLSENTKAPIHGGLYYLSTQQWIEWTWIPAVSEPMATMDPS